jgi:type VI secretion system protein ImpF
LDQLELRVLEALWRYEPRLSRDSISVRVRTGSDRLGTAALIFDIEAELFAEPTPLALRLRTEVDVESGSVAVYEARAEGES